jgi:hypothetical protein
MLIATVDKFAQMAWQGPVQTLFGQVTGWCPRHGFRSPELGGYELSSGGGRFPAIATRPHALLRPPDLIIQDELHLISGPSAVWWGFTKAPWINWRHGRWMERSSTQGNCVDRNGEASASSGVGSI